MPAKAKTVLIKNALRIAVMDDAGTEISGGDIYIEGPEIKKTGKNLRVKADTVLDAKNCVVIPGMVNTHHHLYQTLTRNLPAVQDSKLFDWLAYLYEVWRHITPEGVNISAQVGLGELLLTGCTTSSDHFYLFPGGASADLIDAEIEAARLLGIRFHPCRGSMSRGKSKGGLPPDDVVQTEDEIMKDCERLVNKYHDRRRFAMTRIALAPCSPFSVTGELLKITAQMAKKWDVRMHTHLAETTDENDYCKSVCKMRPLEYMNSAGWLEGGRSWFAHCVHLTEAESRLLGKTGTGVAHCPSSNMRLGSGIAPVRMYLNHGVAVGIGVDGSASNDCNDIMGETRNAMLSARVKTGVAAMSARDALRLATRGGAAVLGRDDIGSLEPGKAADIAVFDMDRIDYAGAMSDPVAALLFCGTGHRAKYVLVNGELAVKDARLLRRGEREITAQANKTAAALYRKAAIIR
ncbi:MAG: 8-oxoguanine deaminase [Elusimicrobiales bacterium]|nr:8-oxoguanine deaminase [Elusimicrobiales bacterium]